MSIYDPIAYVSAVIALTAVVIPAVPVLHFLVGRHVKAEGDPVRGGFKYLHGALFTLFAYVSPPPNQPQPAPTIS
jgi:hypothetical protein